MYDRLFDFYNRELDALRRLGGRFAGQHPKVAGRLRLSPDGVDDPHVARLIESFAFIAARLRLKLDDDLPELSETLLEFLYPHYLAPIPSLAIASITAGAELSGPYPIPRGTSVESEAIEGDVCRFRTTQPVVLWPIQVARASLSRRPFVAPVVRGLDAVACLHVVLECVDPKKTFTELGLDRLRFYLRAPWRQAVDLYELMLNHCVKVALADHAEDQAPVVIGADALAPAGLDEEDAALPHASRGHPAFRLLTELFAYPQKFLFVDLDRIGTKTLRQTGSQLHVFFYLSRHSADLERACSAQTFALGCTPIVNLFEQRAEPVVLSRAVSEYPIVPDARRHATREVYSVDDVSVTERSGQSRAAVGLFGRVAGGEEATLHWQLRRRRLIEGDPGTDARIALVDALAGPASVTDAVLTMDTTCLNRDLPARLPYGGGHPVLSIARNAADLTSVQALTPFTPTLRLAGADRLLWRLLSHLKLGHLSLADGDGGPGTLRELLRLYDYRDTPETHAMIDALSAVDHRRSTARVAGGGLARGLDVELEFDTRAIEPGQAFLFGQVLDRFFGLYVNLNSFTRLSVRLKGQARPLKTWAPRSGAKALA